MTVLLPAATSVLALVFALARTGRGALAAPSVGAYIGAAYWFTASTSFANPAVTIGRIFSDTFAGIDPASVPGFVAAQLVGGLTGELVGWAGWQPVGAGNSVGVCGLAGALAVAVLTVDYGHPPYIALLLAASFGSYGLIKKRLPVRPS